MNPSLYEAQIEFSILKMAHYVKNLCRRRRRHHHHLHYE
jgi:hypothetical protein